MIRAGSTLLALGMAAMALGGCGSNNEQRAATGAGTGAMVGAVAGGPIGLAVGAGVGAVAGDQEKNIQTEATKLKNEHSTPARSQSTASRTAPAQPGD